MDLIASYSNTFDQVEGIHRRLECEHDRSMLTKAFDDLALTL